MQEEFSADEEAHLLKTAETAIAARLKQQYDSKKITLEIYEKARDFAYPQLHTWVTDPSIRKLSPMTRIAILNAIRDGKWDDLVEVFRQEIDFGTAGIRGLAALTKEALEMLKSQGAGASILKGPNTINDIVLLLKTAGVILYMRERGLKKVAVGYDSRIAGREFAELIAQSFVGSSTEEHPFQIYLFDNASPFPELSFGLTTEKVRADIGILISASHNPANYNGYKITNFKGAQLTGTMRDEIVETIKRVRYSDIKLAPLGKAKPGQLIWLGGEKPRQDLKSLDRYRDDPRPYEEILKDYYQGVDLSQNFIDMHRLHAEQVKKFIIDKPLVKGNAKDVRIGFAAYNGAGNETVPRLFNELGFTQFKAVTALQELDGMFPVFGWGEQPDPGDPIAGERAVGKFIEEYGQKEFDDLDLLVGTDPDADRMGATVKVPAEQQKYFGAYKLLPANDAWTVLLWYRFMRIAEANGGTMPDVDRQYITFSHVTTDALEEVGRFFHVRSLGEMLNKPKKKGEAPAPVGGYLNGRRSWVGFSFIAAFADKLREDGYINQGGLEESNGFSILGGKVSPGEVLAPDGHVNDKDGGFAAVLLAEAAVYAKTNKEAPAKSIFEMLDYIYKKIGYYATANKPMPRIGSFKGAEGISKKINLLKKAQVWMEEANAKAGSEQPFVLAGMPVIGAVQWQSGRYDDKHYEGFPDEGIRFFFPDENLKPGDDFTKSRNYITIRPSGTSQTIRFYTQLFTKIPEELQGDALGRKKWIREQQANLVSLRAQKELLEATRTGEEADAQTYAEGEDYEAVVKQLAGQVAAIRAVDHSIDLTQEADLLAFIRSGLLSREPNFGPSIDSEQDSIQPAGGWVRKVTYPGDYLNSPTQGPGGYEEIVDQIDHAGDEEIRAAGGSVTYEPRAEVRQEPKRLHESETLVSDRAEVRQEPKRLHETMRSELRMLVLSRKPDERIQIGDNITVTVLEVKKNSVRLGIKAPADVPILRGELLGSAEPKTGREQAVVKQETGVEPVPAAPQEAAKQRDGVGLDLSAL
jgi:phosphoglucomutase